MTGRTESQLKPKIEKTCTCGNVFTTSHARKKFCSRDCLNEKNSNSPIWNSYQRDIKYKVNYGISLEDYNQLFEGQEGKCAICKKHQTELRIRLHVDHCHETGEIRGLLCSKCNLALGLFNDNPILLKRASEYIQW